MPKFDYLETAEKLAVRIHAHTAYAKLKLEDWLLDWLGDCPGQRLLEVGCGDGNFFPTYERALGPGGKIIGFDVNERLLEAAIARAQTLGTDHQIMHWDFDQHPFPIDDGEVDILIAPYSAYYTNDVEKWVDDSIRVIKPGGRLLLLGPTRDNAKELYELNEAALGIRSVYETDATSVMLEEEFFPALENRLGARVTKSVLNRQIIFPSPEAFARYYFATWLFEKTQEKLGKLIDPGAVLEAARESSLTLSKQIVCIEAVVN